MPFIKVIPEQEATDELKNVYENISNQRGKLSNILKIQSLLPNTMGKHLDFYVSVMFDKSRLSREDRELLATVVSSANRCDYCINHHAEALKHYWKDDELVETAIQNFRTLDIHPKKIAMLEYAEKLTLYPWETSEDDVESLRSIGYSDQEILNITLVIGYFNFVNRMANGLGVEYDEEEMKGYKY